MGNNSSTLRVGDRYQQGDWIWEVIEITADRVKARRAGSVVTVTQSLDDQNHSTTNSSTVWRGQCGVCMNWFEHPERTEDNPSPAGTFCPVCRDERRMTAPGVVHWKAEALNV